MSQLSGGCVLGMHQNNEVMPVWMLVFTLSDRMVSRFIESLFLIFTGTSSVASRGNLR
jgi:hypothetical protein